MAHMYTQMINGETVTQQEPVPGKNMVKNNDVGYIFQLDKWAQLDRFLIIGSDTPTFYCTATNLTNKNIVCLNECLKEDGIRAIDRIVEISTSGRAVKNDTAIFALAVAASYNDNTMFVENNVVTSYALDNLHKVARTATHLFMFVEFVSAMRGWGRALKRAVGNWYTNKKLSDLVYQLIKYKNRNGWTHKDVLRLAHPKPKNEEYSYIFSKVVGKECSIPNSEDINKFNIGNEFASIVDNNVNKAVSLIKTYNFPREVVPTSMLNDPRIWEALMFNDMPMTALIRNLGNMTKCGYIAPLSDGAKIVVEQLTNEDKIKGSRLHPIAIYLAYLTYSAGHGFKGKGEWAPVTAVVDALQEAFYSSFTYVEPSGKKHLIALDVSGSMTWNYINNVPGADARSLAALMAMSIARTEKEYHIIAFDNKITQLNISPTMTLKQIMHKIDKLSYASTDCALPMIYAANNNIPVDVFSVWTDSETNCRNIHPFVALQQYRQKMNRPDAKLVVCAMTSTGFTIADPNDPGMLDIVGFDSAVPQVISEFASGKI